MVSQKSSDGLLQRVIPIEIALVGEAVDLRFGELYQDQVDTADLPSAMCLHPCRGGGTGFSHCDVPSAFGAATAAVLRV